MTITSTAPSVDVASTLKGLRSTVERVNEIEIERWCLILQAVRAGVEWDGIAASLARLRELDAVRAEYRAFLDSAETWTECNPGSRFYGLTNTEVWGLITAFEEDEE